MNNIDGLISSLKEELYNEECVKEYLYYKKIVENDPSIKELDEELRFHQREMCRNKDNDEAYFKEKTIYEEESHEHHEHFINNQSKNRDIKKSLPFSPFEKALKAGILFFIIVSLFAHFKKT